MHGRIFARLLVVCGLFIPAVCNGQAYSSPSDYELLLQRLDAQEAELRALRNLVEAEHEPQAVFFTGHSGPTSDAGSKSKLRRLPVVAEQPIDGKGGGGDSEFVLRYYCDYDRGFVIRPFDRESTPFELKVNAWIQFRHISFSRNTESWTDQAGVTRPVQNRNDFDVERARLVFSGYALRPEVTYFLQLDGDTEGRETVDFFDYWWAIRFSDAFRLQMGKRKVPGSRQWLLGARRTRFIDRPLSNDFFRPDRTVGLFATGEVGENLHYEAMVGNGIRTSNLGAADLNEKFAFAGSTYWDPWGDYGGQLSDYACSETPLARLGASFTYGPQSGLNNGVPLGESDFVRLADGTRLTANGALAPGVTVSRFDLYLLSVDAAAKWRGWSFNAEAFFRWLQEIAGNGALPLERLYQRGFYVEGGKFIIPQKLDFNLRYSQVDGLFGHSEEYAAGFNWYPLDNAWMKISFDVTNLTRSPLNNTSSEILVGDDGTLFRTQFQAEF